MNMMINHDQDAAKVAAFHANRKQALKMIRAAFRALEPLDNVSHNKYLTQLAEQIKAEEKLVERSDDTLTRRERVELYAVWRIAQFMTGHTRLAEVRDYLWTRKHIFIASALVSNYRETIATAWKGFDVELLASIDFATLNK